MTALVYGWCCITPGCVQAGTGDGSDRAAERHVKTAGHATRSWGTPT